METEINSKRNNPLLNRTEIFFTIKHKGEGTPNREIIRGELADKLNVKKESIIVKSVHSSFGNQEITGYAKIYSSLEQSKNIEPDYILIRNKLIEAKEVEKKKGEVKKPASAPKKEGSEEKPSKQKPVEEPVKKPEPAKEPQKDEKAKEPLKEEKKPLKENIEKPTDKVKKESSSKSEQQVGEKKQ